MPQTRDVFAASAELKFVENEPEGTFEGFGSVYGNIDSHSDVIVKGAFADSLRAHAEARTMPRMYVEHSAYHMGGDPLPVGRWTSMVEEDGGLRVKGRLIGMDHPEVKRVADLMREGELNGLSIAFPTPPASSVVFGKSAGEPRRTLKKVHLLSVDIVGDPSNALARIDTMKSVMIPADHAAAAAAITRAMQLHRESLAGGNAPNSEQRSQFMGCLQDAMHALTGQRMPPGMRSAETIRELEAWLHDPVDGLGWPVSKARAVATAGFKATTNPRDEGGEPAADKETLAELRALGDFTLPSF